MAWFDKRATQNSLEDLKEQDDLAEMLAHRGGLDDGKIVEIVKVTRPDGRWSG